MKYPPPTKGNLLPVYHLVDQAVCLINEVLLSVDPEDPWDGAEALVDAHDDLDSALKSLRLTMSLRPTGD